MTSSEDLDQPTPTVPPVVRTTAYVVGIIVGIAGAGIGIALELPVVTGICSAIAGACNALAYGYRPTRTTGDT